MKLLVLTLLFVVLLSHTYSQITFPTFEQYCKTFEKNYSEEQGQTRKKTYEQKIEEMKQITDYQPAVNQFTDWTPQQIKSYRNLLNKPQNQRVSSAVPSNTLLTRVGAPSSLDWRQIGAVTSIKSQGDCGACWAFAAAAQAESYLIIQNRFNNSIDLAEQYILNCSLSNGCNGGYLEFAIATALSLPLQYGYPYNPTKFYSGICSTTEKINVAKTSRSYYKLTDNQIITLLQEAPLAIGISAQNWQYYGSGVFACPTGVQIDHAVLLVGYTPTYWIVKNQWGPSWGQSGYIKITRDTSRNCQIGEAVHKLLGTGDPTNDSKFKEVIAQNTNQSSNNNTNPNNSSSSQTNTNSTTNLNNFSELPLYYALLIISLIGILI